MIFELLFQYKRQYRGAHVKWKIQQNKTILGKVRSIS